LSKLRHNYNIASNIAARCWLLRYPNDLQRLACDIYTCIQLSFTLHNKFFFNAAPIEEIELRVEGWFFEKHISSGDTREKEEENMFTHQK
jgi:hypothetical protein